MTTFEYKGFDAAGRAQSGLVEAADLKDARKRLAARGLLPETLHAVGGQAARRAASHTAFSSETRTMFSRELAALLGSGVALVPALGCDDQSSIDEFRTASAAGLSTGIQAMFGALVEGMIAVYEPDGESSSAAASSGS